MCRRHWPACCSVSPALRESAPVVLGPGAAPPPDIVDQRSSAAIEALVRRRHRAETAARRGRPGRPSATASSIRRRSATARWCPSVEPMTLDTIFDLASLTKVVATTTSVMMLVEQGRDPAHRSGVDVHPRLRALRQGRHHRPPPADAHLRPAAGRRSRATTWAGYDTAIELAIEEVPTAPPGTRFVYSDINFFLLGDIVRRVSGEPLDQFARERIFVPLGMKDTMFNAARVAAAAHRADRELHAVRMAVRRDRTEDAARRRPRSDGAADGRRRRSRRACSAPPPTWRSSAACCSAAAATAARGSCRR